VVLLDIVAAQRGWRSPMSALEDLNEAQRFFFLNRPAGLWRRNTMRTLPPRLLRLETKLADADVSLSLVPVSMFWGRAANKERSLIRSLFSEGWAVSSRFRRFMVLLLNRGDIIVHFGEPLPWPGGVSAQGDGRGESPQPGSARGSPLAQKKRASPELAARRTARLLRTKFRNQKVATLGPDLSHRRTLVELILRSPQVTAAIEAEAADGDHGAALKSARKAANTIAADLSYLTLRFLDVALTWFWHRIYDGIRVHGLDRVATLAETHTVVYTPCHRSHIDYLLLSYVLFHRGFMVPHVAAGDNLDLPLVGGVLRGGGAFFMRRRFSGDRLYSAVFSEYIYQMFRRGHAVEYFVEGGRTRTGRLLPARTGVLQMTIDAHRRGVPRPIVFVPVYVGYDKLVEAASYVDELRGAAKQSESVSGLFRNLRMVRQSFGSAQLCFGKPISLDGLLDDGLDRPARALGARIGRGINACAYLNGTNLVALTTLSMPRQAIDESALVEQIDLYRKLINRDAAHHDAHRRGVPRPIVFVPVYVGYDKLVEAASYVDELRGAAKQSESVSGLFRNLRMVRQSFGSAQLCFGKPISLDGLLDDGLDRPARALGARIGRGINACAYLNGTNLVALTTLSMPRQAIDESALVEQIDLYRKLINRDAAHHDYRVTDMPAEDVVRHVEKLGLLNRDTSAASATGTDGQVLSHDEFTAVLMTWYRNNVLHVLAAPAFVACLAVNRRMGIRRVDINRLFEAVYPYVEHEVQTDGADDVNRWLDHLRSEGLLELRGNVFVAPRDPSARFRLRLLANAVMPVLERFYICMSLLCRAGSGSLDRTTLLGDWTATARRISRLYGLNAPEFSDPRLIDGFLQHLTEAGMLENEAGKLVFDERVPEIVRAAQGVIAVDLRQAMERG